MAFDIVFSPEAWSDYLCWQMQDKKTLRRINGLLRELSLDCIGFSGTEWAGHADGMSMQIDGKNRLGFTVEDDNLVILSCMGSCEY